MAEEPPTSGEHKQLAPMEFIDLRTGERVLATTGDLTRWLQPEEPQPAHERLDFMAWTRQGGIIRPSYHQRPRRRWWQVWRRDR